MVVTARFLPRCAEGDHHARSGQRVPPCDLSASGAPVPSRGRGPGHRGRRKIAVQGACRVIADGAPTPPLRRRGGQQRPGQHPAVLRLARGPAGGGVPARVQRGDRGAGSQGGQPGRPVGPAREDPHHVADRIRPGCAGGGRLWIDPGTGLRDRRCVPMRCVTTPPGGNWWRAWSGAASSRVFSGRHDRKGRRARRGRRRRMGIPLSLGDPSPPAAPCTTCWPRCRAAAPYNGPDRPVFHDFTSRTGITLPRRLDVLLGRRLASAVCFWRISSR